MAHFCAVTELYVGNWLKGRTDPNAGPELEFLDSSAMWLSPVRKVRSIAKYSDISGVALIRSVAPWGNEESFSCTMILHPYLFKSASQRSTRSQAATQRAESEHVMSKKRRVGEPEDIMDEQPDDSDWLQPPAQMPCKSSPPRAE